MRCSAPRENGYNYCAFCHYWEGNAGLHSYGCGVEFDDRAKGQCLKMRSQRNAGVHACPKFQMSNEASRYCR